MTEQKIAKNRKKTKVASTASYVINKSTHRRVLSGRDFYQISFVRASGSETSITSSMPTSAIIYDANTSAFGYELRSFIQSRIWIGPQHGQFFCQAQSAVHCTAAIRFGFANHGPFYDRNVTLIFDLPNKL